MTNNNIIKGKDYIKDKKQYNKTNKKNKSEKYDKLNKKTYIPPPEEESSDDNTNDIICSSEIASIPSSKLDEEFVEKCYAYSLPFNWIEEYTLTNVHIDEKKKISKTYNKLKRKLILKSIQLTDILKLKGITNDERIDLVEAYAIMQSLDSDLYEYIKFRDDLKSRINYFKGRKIPISEIIAIENKKVELKKINLSSDETEQKILKLSIDSYSQAQIYQKFSKLSTMSSMDS